MRTKNVPILLLAITGTLLIGGCEKQTADSTPGTVPDLTSSSEAPIQVDILSETSVDPLPEQDSTTDPTSQDRTQTAPQTDNATPAAAAPKTDNTAAETPKTDSNTAAETVTVTKAFQPNEGWTSDFFFQIPQDWSYTIDEDTIEWGFLIQVSGQEDASLCIYGRYGTVNVEPFYTDAPTDFETSSGLKGRFYQNIHTDEDGSSYIEGDIVFDLRSYGVRFYMPETVYTEYKDTLQAVFRSIRIENTFTE